MALDFRSEIADYIRRAALPEDKYGHQPRLYALTQRIGEGMSYDEDVVYAAAWLHDLGVFVGHRPEDPEKLAKWDHVIYTVKEVPAILERFGFPTEKIPAVLEVIQNHQPKDEPSTVESTILRDADILEQLGAIGILRGVSKVGRDTRFQTFTSAVQNLGRSLQDLPSRLKLESSRKLAAPKINLLASFLNAVEEESKPDLY
jgi:uncharacterized protein